MVRPRPSGVETRATPAQSTSSNNPRVPDTAQVWAGREFRLLAVACGDEGSGGGQGMGKGSQGGDEGGQDRRGRSGHGGGSLPKLPADSAGGRALHVGNASAAAGGNAAASVMLTRRTGAAGVGRRGVRPDSGVDSRPLLRCSLRCTTLSRACLGGRWARPRQGLGREGSRVPPACVWCGRARRSPLVVAVASREVGSGLVRAETLFVSSRSHAAADPRCLRRCPPTGHVLHALPCWGRSRGQAS